MSGRTLAIGDIHGCDVALEGLLSRLELTADDTVVALGDVIDRGPNTKRAVELLLDAAQTCRLVFLMGNHEEMMLTAIHQTSEQSLAFWLGFGGQETLDSYGGNIDDIPQKHLDFFNAASCFETESEIFVHAGIEAGVSLEQQTGMWLRWYKLTGDEAPHHSGKRIICGHTALQSGLPMVFDGWVCIDTWVYGDGYLTCLDVATNEIFQTQQSGTMRDGFTLNDLPNSSAPDSY